MTNKRKNRKKFKIDNFVKHPLSAKDERWIVQRSIILREKNVARHHQQAIKAYFKKNYLVLFSFLLVFRNIFLCHL